jgi:hypothetical protein
MFFSFFSSDWLMKKEERREKRKNRKTEAKFFFSFAWNFLVNTCTA